MRKTKKLTNLKNKYAQANDNDSAALAALQELLVDVMGEELEKFYGSAPSTPEVALPKAAADKTKKK